MSFDRDRDAEAFEAYKKLYKGKPWSLFDFENLKSDSTGYYVELKRKEQLSEDEINTLGIYTNMIEKYGGEICLSGDADFGMKESNTLDDGTEKKDMYCYAEQLLLESPKKKMHELENFSLLIVNAGLNSRKGLKNCYRDIFPRYIAVLYSYYEQDNEEGKIQFVKEKLGKLCLGSRPSKNMTEEEYKKRQDELTNRYYEREIPSLICYLDLFGSFENYCIQTYFFGDKSDEIKTLIKEMKEFGEKIDNRSFYEKGNIQKYCELANKYWKLKGKIIHRILDSTGSENSCVEKSSIMCS